jgi:hypothetical protein
LYVRDRRIEYALWVLAQRLRVYRVVLVTTLGWTLVKEKS